eukprot:5736068-Lingulodinium_polyedra.AAC.1
MLEVTPSAQSNKWPMANWEGAGARDSATRFRSSCCLHPPLLGLLLEAGAQADQSLEIIAARKGMGG